MKTRMNQGHRDALRAFAKRYLEKVYPSTEVDAAYAEADKAVRRLVEENYPKREMKTLLKYEVAERADSISVQLTAGGFDRFYFKSKPDNLPLVPRKSSWTGICVPADQQATDAINKYNDTFKRREETIKTRLTDYRDLILVTKYVEDLLEVWPEATEVTKTMVQSQALVRMNPAVINRIKSDSKTMAKQAA